MIKTTQYFETFVTINHPEADRYRHKLHIALTEYIAIEKQPEGRTARWIYIGEADKYMRVVIMADGETIHNAFWDRDFRRSL
ncbi:MAG: hypothetical protein HOE48_25500 [Candidatus Latescibacteria bacterium]|nr:hypothetical protein [Candidatus Latescibacterota bacterium]MBT4141288.1 hypothetical protein [Candidatus Latescibacterota bacterium]